MLYVERGPDGPLPVLTRKRTVDEHGPVNALQLLMNGELDNLVPELWDVEAPRLRLRDRLVTIGAGVVFLLSLLRARADRLELPPEFDVVDLGEEVVS